MLLYIFTLVILPILSNGQVSTALLGSLVGMVLDCIVLPSVVVIAINHMLRARFSAVVRNSSAKGTPLE